MKKLNITKIDFFSSDFEICCENHTPKRHIKIKVINFTSSNKSIKANKTVRIRAKP